MEDKILTCRDCGRQFTFTVSEQQFFAQKGFTNDPSRCPECRATRKASRTDTGFGVDSRRNRKLYPAVCAQCGKETQVPFEPRQDRPVYCSDCYSSQRQSAGYEHRSNRGNRGRW